MALIRVLRYLKTTINDKLTLRVHDMSSNCNLTIETDSDWASYHIYRKSYSGSCIFYNGSILNFLVSKQATVSISSTEAEYIALSEAVKEGLYFVNLIDEIIPVNLPVKTYIYNIGAGFIAQMNDVNNSKTKHIDIRYHLVRDWIAKGTTRVVSRGLQGQSRRHLHQGLAWTSASRPVSSSPRWTLPFVADLKPGVCAESRK